MVTTHLFLLPCSCGEKVRVRPRHAGETVTCQCGTKLQVPTLRGLKQLETVDEVEEFPAASPSMLQGPLFAIGLLALFAGVVLLAITLGWPPAALQMKVNEVTMTEYDLDRSQVPVEELGASTLYDEFLYLRDRARGDQFYYALSLLDAGRMSYKSRLMTGGVIAAIGALLAAASLALPLLGNNSPRKS